ncbi:hypothetical protein E4U21_007148 [Claviceps maximensis]|nr:hypothetical protein E4U21_007148 [Claviceps maximensis]
MESFSSFSSCHHMSSFGDVHYFYGSAAVEPRHHRFDKGSYVYLFENAAQRRCRIEVANHPGTDEQDAFDGLGDTVDDVEWHLPSYDLKNETKYYYKLHSLDIYFWTFEDALQFVNGVRRVLPTTQVEILDEPAPQSDINTVIQRLEDVEFSDPQFHLDSSSLEATSHRLSTKTASITSANVPTNLPLPLPPPPPPPQTANFMPMAYNPAAPAAPEPIKYREKTPPPDEDPLNPLAVAVAHDYEKQPFTPASLHQSQFPLGVTSPRLPPNRISNPVNPPHFSEPLQQPGLNRADTMPTNAPLTTPGLTDSFGNGTSPGPTASSLTSPPLPRVQLPSSPPTPAHSSQQLSASRAPLTQTTQAQSYSNSHSHVGQHDSTDYTIHQQFYRPSESELIGNKGPQYQAKTEPRRKIEENASRLERGVTGMLKKFEKKFG